MDVKVFKEKYLKSTADPVVRKLEEFEDDLKFVAKPQALGDYTRYINSLTAILNDASKIELKLSTDSMKQAFEQDIDEQMLAFADKRVALDEKFEAILQDKIDELVKEAKEHNKKVREQFHAGNEIYEQLEEKRKILESYNDDIVNLCAEYGITTSDVQVDNSSFTIEELGDIYDQYIKYMGKLNTRKNFVGLIREKLPDAKTQLIFVAALCGLAFTPVLDLLTIVFLVYIFKSQASSEKKMKSYAVLLGLLYNVRPLELGFKADIDPSLLVSEEINEDEDPRLDSIAEEWLAAVDEMDKKDPEATAKTDRVCFAMEVDRTEKEFMELSVRFKVRKDNFIEKVTKLLETAKQEFEDGKAKVVKLGDAVNKSAVFDTKFKLGIKDGVIEEVVDVGLKNMIIYPSNDEHVFKQFLHVLFANAMCAVKANNLTVTVYDPNKFGQDLVGFYDPALEKILIFENESMSKTIESLKAFAGKNLKDMKGMSINEFNTAAEKVGRTPKEYRLLIVLSQPKSIEEDEALREFMSYSANLGVLIWMVAKQDLPGTTIWHKPFEGIKNPYEIDEYNFGPHVAKTVVTAIKEASSDALLWTDFIKVVVPDEKMWTGVTDQFIELYPGFFEGDPTQPIPYTVGNEGNVHLIGVGGTGAGKSVFINELIATATRQYSPRDLELWLVDYKGSEFSFYLSTPEHPKVLPHLKACLCTSDGDYSGSLYAALRSESERRYLMLMDAGFKNIKDFNKHVRKGVMYTEIVDGKTVYYNKAALEAAGMPFDPAGKTQLTIDDIVPRILFINDEFQVIFQKAEGKIVEGILKDITYISKVARAAGVHLAFFSQSMKGTIKDDILQQFTLRFALRCDQEVSMAILGTKYASEIKQKFGFLYTRSLEDKSLEAQRRFRTPFVPDGVLRDHINKMSDLAQEKHFKKRDLISYLEDTKHYVDEIDEVYNKSGNIPNGLILLGMRMTYSSNKAPDNVILGPENNTHIFSAFGETIDVVNFYKSIYRNLMLQKEKPLILTNTQVKDLYYLCELDKTVPPDLQRYASEKTNILEILDMVEQVYTMRSQNGCKNPPVYIILLGWDKAMGFGIDREYDIASKVATLEQLCGEFNMHFIYICTGTGQISDNVISPCKVRICGKVDEGTSYKVLETKQGSKVDDKLKNGYMYINRGGVVTRAKIYQSRGNREIQSSELVL